MKGLGPAAWFARGFLLVALLVATAACEGREERVARHQARGLEFVAAGAFEKARLEFHNAVRIDPDFAPGYFQLALLREREGDLAAMAALLQRVIEIEPEHVAARVRLAQLALIEPAPDIALDHAEAAMRFAPGDPEALAARALVRLQLGNTVGARADAEAALAKEPFQPQARMVLVNLALEAGRPKEALAMIERHAEARPRDLAMAGLKLGILETMGDQAAIGAHLAWMAQTFPELPNLRLALAEWHLSQGDTAKAAAEYRAMVAAAPQNVEAALAYVGFLERTGGAEAARAELERLAQAEGAPFALLAALAELEDRLGLKEAARARMRAAIAAPKRPEDANAARRQLARLLNQDGAAAEALALVDAVLASDPGDLEALALRAAMRLDAGETGPALVDLRRALRESPRHPSLLTLTARAHLIAGNEVLAGENLAGAMQASGFEPEMTLRYAEFLARSGRLGPAESVLSEAARRHPGHRPLLGSLAELRLRLGDWVGAEAVADALRDLDAGDGLAERIRAAARLGQERFDESLQILETLAARTDEREASMAALISAYLRAGRRERAEAFLAEVLKDDPGNVQALYLRGALGEQLGDPAAAETSYRAILAAAPELMRGYEILAEFQLRQNAPDGARQTLRDGLARDPDHVALRLRLAQLLEQGGDFDAAIAEYERLHAAEPQSIVVLNNLVSLVTDHYAEDQARLAAALEKARLLVSSDIPEIRDTYGWALYLAGDYEGALRSLAPAAEALPDNPWVRLHAGLAYAKLGRAEEARAHLAAVLALTKGADFPRREVARAALEGLGG